MGSFNVNCSITNKTISFGDEMVIQLMVPSWIQDYQTPTGKTESTTLSMKIFLNNVTLYGLDKALEKYNKIYDNIQKEEKESGQDIAPKGLIVSDNAVREWIPVGPAIRGTYADYGNIEPANDPETVKRLEVLQKIFYGIPFVSIMEAATDTRWLNLGIKRNDKMWVVEGLNSDLSENALTFFKKLSVTYFHASVYDTIKQFDFSAEDGIVKSKFNKDWKSEFLDRNKSFIPALRKRNGNININNNDIKSILEIISEREEYQKFLFYKEMNIKTREEYLDRLSLIVNDYDTEWLWESLSFCYGLSEMCIDLRQSQYGSQHRNWKGWQCIEEALNPILIDTVKKEKEMWGDDEDEETE